MNKEHLKVADKLVCHVGHYCSATEIAQAIQEAELRGKEEGRYEERETWFESLKHHRPHCSAYGNKELTQVMGRITGENRIKWKLLFETLSKQVLEYMEFPGETNDGRCPLCDDKLWCPYCIASVEPQEAQGNIEEALNKARKGDEK